MTGGQSADSYAKMVADAAEVLPKFWLTCCGARELHLFLQQVQPAVE